MKLGIAAAVVALLATLAAPAQARPIGPPGPWIFVGDSLTRGLHVDQDQAYPEVFASETGTLDLNYGRNGSCLVAAGCYAWQPWTTDFASVAFSPRPIRPKRIIVLLGTNDLCHPDATPVAVEAGYLRLAWIARTHGTPITFLTLLPHGPQYDHCEQDRADINAWLLRSTLDVVDAASPLTDETGRLDPAYDSGDGLHINAAGHAVVAEALEEHFRAS